MIICVDCDNVLNNLAEKTLELYNLRSGKNIQLNDITTYNFYDCLPMEDADGIIALFKEKELWDSLKPLPGAQIALNKLIKAGHEIYIATATDSCNFEWKVQWLAKYYSFIPTDNIIRIVNKSLLNVNMLIEDNLDNLKRGFCEPICLDYPWNQNSSIDYIFDIHRIKSWYEIEDVINNIEEENRKWNNT